MIPVTLVGGYLGAGKTTLINLALRAADGRRLTILVNDFGDVNIDADLIESVADGVMRLSGGCVCCSIGSDLVGALLEVAGAADPPDRVIIETSGVALPASVAASLRLAQGLSLDAIVVLAATDQIEHQVADRYVGDTVARQLAQADLLVPTRQDLADAATVGRVTALLERQAPRAVLLQGALDQVAAQAVLDPLAVPRRAATALPSAHGTLAGTFWQRQRLRAPAPAASLFEAVTLRAEGPIDTQALMAALTDPALHLVRAKGVLADHAGGARLLQMVGSRAQLTPAPADHPSCGRLVCIGLRAHRPATALSTRLAAVPALRVDPPADAL